MCSFNIALTRTTSVGTWLPKVRQWMFYWRSWGSIWIVRQNSHTGHPPTSRYDLRAYYYLGRSLDKIEDKKTAQEAYAAMPNFKDGLATLEEQLAHQPDYPHVARLRQDVAELKIVIGNR